MKKWLIKFRGFGVTKRELIADIIFFLIPFFISLLALFFFDIHWSFYPNETILPPSKFIGLTASQYLATSITFAVIGFFIIKLFLIGVKKSNKK
ncbi:MAG: hypothetical protein AABW51_02995 [Nanoarchaeota archaeon]